MTDLEHKSKSPAADTVDGQPGRLQLAQAGAHEFGIFADKIAAIIGWREPTPLPRAPESVLGVVSIQGRMLTVLDLAAIPLDDSPANLSSSDQHNHIIALKGEEQLALAVAKVGEIVEFKPDACSLNEKPSLVLGCWKRNEKPTYVLNLQELFPASIHGKERRRRRF
jgi:chemotaxis signal transduction protein